MKSYISISKSVSVRTAAIAALIASTLAAGVAGAAEYRVPGSCFKTFSQEVRKDGSTYIRIQTTCEYGENYRGTPSLAKLLVRTEKKHTDTPAQKARLAKEGR